MNTSSTTSPPERRTYSVRYSPLAAGISHRGARHGARIATSKTLRALRLDNVNFANFIIMVSVRCAFVS